VLLCDTLVPEPGLCAERGAGAAEREGGADRLCRSADLGFEWLSGRWDAERGVEAARPFFSGLAGNELFPGTTEPAAFETPAIETGDTEDTPSLAETEITCSSSRPRYP